MKKIIGLLLALFLLVLAYITYDFVLDEPLTKQSEEWLSAADYTQHPIEPSNAFVMSMAIDYGHTKNLFGQGKAIIEDIQKTPIDYSSNPVSDSDNKKNIQFATVDQPCNALNINFVHCINQKPKTYFKEQSEKTTELRQTFLTLLKKSEFVSILPNNLDNTSIIPFKAYLEGQNALIVHTIHLANTNQHSQAWELLNTNIQQTRKHLASTNTLVAKMIFNASLHKALNTASLLHHTHQSKPDFTLATHPLNTQETSLNRALQTELAFFSELIKHCKKYTKRSPEEDNRCYQLKHNADINLISTYYSKVAELSEQTARQYIVKRKELAAFKPEFKASLHKRLIYQMITPNFTQYADRLFELNDKLKLLNIVLSNPNYRQTLDNTAYATESDGSQPYIDTSDTDQPLLCYKGRSEEKQYRCLPI